MKAIAVIAALLVGQASTSTVELNSAQKTAAIAAFDRQKLEGLKSFSLDVEINGIDGPFKADDQAFLEAIELELRRSGIAVNKDSKDHIFVNATILSTYSGQYLNGYCASVRFQVMEFGFADKWARAGLLELYSKSQLFTTGSKDQAKLQERSVDMAKSFCLEWLRQNEPKS